LLRRYWNGLAYWLTREGLSSPFMLITLLWVNLLGTVYGYYWYAGQLEDTIANHPLWRAFLVPDSPTASLFFTVSILWMYKQPDRRQLGVMGQGLRSLIEALAVVTSVKYGVWAVAMIFAGAAQGDPLTWQDWMLSASHLGMAAEALLYIRFFRIGYGVLAATALWTLYNDFADYTFDIFPWLPGELYDDLNAVQWFTISLSIFSLLLAWAASRFTPKSTV
jgi:uncharacterized membrane protein YpjA